MTIVLKLGISIVSLFVTILLGIVLNKTIGPSGSFLWWSNADLKNALLMIIALPATFVVIYIGLSQRFQGMTGRAALIEAIIALIFALLVMGLYSAFIEWQTRYTFHQQERQRDALTAASPYTITAMKDGVVTARATNGMTIKTTSPLFLYTLGGTSIDLSAVPHAIKREISEHPYQLVLNGRVGDLIQDEAGNYLVAHNRFGFVNNDGIILTPQELLTKAIRRIGTTRYYEKLSYQDLTEVRDYQHHYSNIYLESETGDTIIYNARLVHCVGEDDITSPCQKMYSMLASGINRHRLQQADYRDALHRLAIVSQPVALTGIDTPQGFFVYEIRFF